MLYIDISDKIILYILEHKLQPGDKLPTFRKFADIFGVSMHTVSSALGRLQYKGIVDIRPQSGIFIMEEAWKALNPNVFNWQDYFKKLKAMPVDLLKRFYASRKNSEDEKPGYVLSNSGLSPEFGWYEPWKEALHKAVDNLSPDNIAIINPEDISRYTNVLTEFFEYHGLNVPKESLLLTRGIYNSLLYIMLTFFKPGTVCYYVSPSMLDVSGLIDSLGLIKAPLPTGKHGIDLDYFSERINKASKSFLVISPEIAKTGMTMSMQTRRALYHICHSNQIPIIEIDEYRCFHSSALPPIKALDKHGIVFYVGDFARILHTSADPGWVIAAPELIERLKFLIISMWEDTQAVQHQMIYEMLTSGAFDKYVKNLQAMMREREHILNNLLEKYLGDIATWNRKSEVFFWVKFKDYIDVQKIADNDKGLTLAEHSRYAFAENNSILISLTHIKIEQLENAIKLLSQIARKSVV